MTIIETIDNTPGEKVAFVDLLRFYGYLSSFVAASRREIFKDEESEMIAAITIMACLARASQEAPVDIEAFANSLADLDQAVISTLSCPGLECSSIGVLTELGVKEHTEAYMKARRNQ